MNPALLSLKALGHYIEQPQVIAKAQKLMPLIGVGGMGLLAARDVKNAPPEERMKVLLRDTLVLGATAVGTLAGVRWRMNKGKVLQEAKAGVESFIANAVHLMKSKGYPEDLITLMQKPEKSVQDLKTLVRTIAGRSKADLQEIMPVNLEGGGFGKAIDFFIVGGFSVASGLLGGLLANKLNGDNSREKTVDMVKEGLFQFIANIAMCAVGAIAALSILNFGPVKQKLQHMGMAGKLIRTGGICAGLSVGILGGGVIANWMGQRFINPFFDKMQGKAPSPPHAGGKRNIEFADAILHLDDLPTALALAGVAIMEPFIPLFFGFSGYRTGIGYRNDKTAAPQNPSLLAGHRPLQSQLAHSSRTFQVFSSQLSPSPSTSFSGGDRLSQAKNPFAGRFQQGLAK